MAKKLHVAEEREKAHASKQEDVVLVHVGDMPVDLRRFRVQCQKYFNTLRVVQLKSHCVRDKSPAKFMVSYKDRTTIDVQSLLDKGAAIESQDATYMFRPLDTFNKGHFHSHKLLIPWSVTSGGKCQSQLLCELFARSISSNQFAGMQTVGLSIDPNSSRKFGSSWAA